MRRVGGLLLVTLVVGGLLGSAASAGAAELPTYDGLLDFPDIHSAGDPEEFSWQIGLEPGEELQPIDDQHAVVSYGAIQMFRIEAGPAHDVTGAAVPTTLAVTGTEVVTLTVHHRAGNPAAGGAPFAYPVAYGAPFQVGFSTVEVIKPSPPPTTTATTAAPERVLVTRALGEDKLYYRPHFFLLSGDGTFGINKVQWKGYGAGVATATGRAFANDCIPNCAAGHDFKPQAKLTLSKIVQCQGHPVYSRLRYQLIGKLPKGLRRRGGDPMLPLGEDGKPDC